MNTHGMNTHGMNTQETVLIVMVALTCITLALSFSAAMMLYNSDIGPCSRYFMVALFTGFGTMGIFLVAEADEHIKKLDNSEL